MLKYAIGFLFWVRSAVTPLLEALHSVWNCWVKSNRANTGVVVMASFSFAIASLAWDDQANYPFFKRFVKGQAIFP